MNEDSYLDGFMEDHLNDGYGHILDAQHEADAFEASIDPIFGDEDCPDDDKWYDEDYPEDEDWDDGDKADPGWADGDLETGLAAAGPGTDEDYGSYHGFLADVDDFIDDSGCPF